MKWNLIGGFCISQYEAESVIGGRPCQSRRGGRSHAVSGRAQLDLSNDSSHNPPLLASLLHSTAYKNHLDHKVIL